MRAVPFARISLPLYLLILAACTPLEPLLETGGSDLQGSGNGESPVAAPAITQANEISSPATLREIFNTAPSIIDSLAIAESLRSTPEQDEVTERTPETELALGSSPMIDLLCREIGNKLGSVSVADCNAQDLKFDGFYSVQNRPLAIRDFQSGNGDSSPRVLILGGIHGDEYSSISIMFKWMEILGQGETEFYWRFLPSTNPDGLLDGSAVRQNANGVDLNRNFPTEDWLDMAHKNWVESTGRNRRRFPGTSPASEPEVQWLVRQIEVFKPDVIVSVHAPYHLLDYDGPPEAPEQIGELYLHQLGVYPGSLGNYGGIDLGIPVVTLELPSAGIMPSNQQIASMWLDLVAWLQANSLQLTSR